MDYKIAEVPVSLSGECLDVAYSAMAPYEATAEKGSAALRICCRAAPSISAAEPDEIFGVRNHIEEYGRAADGLLSQDRYPGGSYATHRYAEDFHSVVCTLADVEPLGGESLAGRMAVAVGKSFLNCLPAFGAVTYHASCITYQDEALLFCAPSGTGKSTHTGLWKKIYPTEVEIINDDTPVIRERKEVFYAYGTPWAGTSGINANRSAPIRAIVYLERAQTNEICALSVQQAVLNAMKSARVQFFPVQRERQTRLLFRLARAVPFYRLRCAPTEEAVATVKSFLY